MPNIDHYRTLTLPQLQAELEMAKRATFMNECNDSYGMRSVIDACYTEQSIINSVIKEKMG